MKKRILISLLALSVVLFGTLHICCQLFDPPTAPEKTKISVIFRASDSRLCEGSLVDSVGKPIEIGAALYLPDNFDSLSFIILDGDNIVYDTMFRTFMDGYFYDTIWVKQTYWTPGIRNLTITPYANPVRSAIGATITIKGIPQNTAPQWSVDTLRRTVKVGNQLSQELPEICNDAERDLITYTLISGAPANDTIVGTTYQFNPTEQNAGIHIAQIKASDPAGGFSILPVKITVDNGPGDTSSEYQVVYNGNSNTAGAAPVDPGKYKTGTTVTVNGNTGNMVKVGFTFAGWNTASDGSGTPYAAGVTFPMGSANVTLYAKWTTTASYAITFNSNGGSGTMANQTIVSGMSVPLSANTFTKSGSVFAGWMTSATGTTSEFADKASYTMGGSNVILYALWTQNPLYKITFNSNGGTGTMADQSIVSGLSAPLVANAFTKAGSTFAGWVTTATGTTTEFADKASYTMGGSNVILYALWTQNPSFKITFNSNGGNGTMADQSIVLGISAPLSANTFTKSGSVFAGWTTSATGTTVEYTDAAPYLMGGSNVILYALWSQNPLYKITFNSNGGTGTMADQSIVSGLSAPLVANTFTKQGSTFAGWNTAADGSGTPFAAGVAFSMGSADVILYAQWTVNNVAPTVSTLSITPNPVNQGASVSFSATTNFGTAYPAAVYRLVKSPYTAAADTIASGTVASATISYSVAATYAHQVSYKMVVRNSIATVESAPVALTVSDVTAPVVILTGSAAVTVNQNSSWTDPGATATDDRDGTKTVVISGTVNLAAPGTYTVKYTATDNAGNSSYKERTVTVVAVWVKLGKIGASKYSFALDKNEVLHFPAGGTDVNKISIYKLSNGNPVEAVSTPFDGYSAAPMALSLGSDGTTWYLGCVSGESYHNGGDWQIIDEAGWEPIGGYSMHLGTGNTLYVGAMGTNYKTRIWKFNSGVWNIVGDDISLPLGNSEGRYNEHFCVTSSNEGYTIGSSQGNLGVSVAYCNGSSWNINEIESATEEWSNHQIVASGSIVYSGYTKLDGDAPVIHQWSGSGRTYLPSMANAPAAAGDFSIACSPSGVLYAVHIENYNVVAKKFVGSSWQSLPGTSVISTAYTDKIQIVAGAKKCYVIIEASTESVVWCLDIN